MIYSQKYLHKTGVVQIKVNTPFTYRQRNDVCNPQHSPFAHHSLTKTVNTLTVFEHLRGKSNSVSEGNSNSQRIQNKHQAEKRETISNSADFFKTQLPPTQTFPPRIFPTEQTETSLIWELLSIDQSKIHKSTAISTNKKRLQQLLVTQTNSILLDDSGIFDEGHSEIIQLTGQQKQFFTNFIRQENGTFKQTNSLMVQSLTCQNDSRSQFKQTIDTIDKKMKVIRNFFRKKESQVKQQKTCCNSATSIEDSPTKYVQPSITAPSKSKISYKLFLDEGVRAEY